MDELELDQACFFQMFHAMLRVDGSDEEIDRTSKVMEWVQRDRNTIARVFSKTEITLVGVILEHWMQHKTCPSRILLDTMLLHRDKPQALQDLVATYDKLPDLKYTTDADMSYYLGLRIEDYEKSRLLRILQNAKEIVSGSVQNPAHTQRNPLPNLEGTRDALGYVMERFQRGVLVNEVRADGGLLSNYKDRVKETYNANRASRLDGKLFIPTGIPLIDNHMGGLRRKELNGVLGYTGQRKTAVVRTMAYNAASAGFRVLHIPLESDFSEELTSYNVMHAHAGSNFNMTKLNRRRYDAGEMTDEEFTKFMDQVVPDFAETIGKNLIVYDPKGGRTWADVKAVIERENYIHPLDLVIVDYLTLLGDVNARDQVAAKMLMIQDAKQLTLNGGGVEGNGFCLVTPVQGNRKGYEEAVEHDGAWETTGIAQYSEMDKSLDNCFYVFTNDEISANNGIKIGTCKHRRGSNIPSTLVPLNVNAGMLSVEDNKSTTTVDIAVSPAAAQPTPNADGHFFGYLGAHA